MKKYKVLEAHQGDKFYKPGDPETGTRVADPNAVGHLVTLGLLEEIGDADTSTADDGHVAEMLARLRDPTDGPRLVAEFKERFEAFDRDRQELTKRVAAGEDALRDAIAERDAARADHAAAVAGRDTLVQELDAARAALADRPAGTSEQSSGDSAFDHDGDGRPGGSKPRAARKSA